MTESEWMTSEDPAAMLSNINLVGSLHGILRPVSDRKLRLFACACCRQVWQHLDGRDRKAVVLAERWADGDDDLHDVLYDLISNSQGMTRILHWADAVAVAASAVDSARRHNSVVLPTYAALLREIVGNPFRPTVSPHDWEVPCPDCPKGKPDQWCDGCGSSGTVRGVCPWLTPTVLALARMSYENPVVQLSPDEGYKRFVTSIGTTNGRCLVCGYVTCGEKIERNHRRFCTGSGILDPERLAVLADPLEEAGCTDDIILQHLRGWEKCRRCNGTGQEHCFLGIKGDFPCDGCKNDGWVNGKGTGWSRIRGPHVRGCWAVDLILGKE